MVRTSLAVAVLGVLATAAGCTMCCHSYDYCGPIYDGPYATGCEHNLRANSVFSGTAQMPPSTPTARQKAQGAQPTAQPPAQPALQSEPQSGLQPEPQLVPQPMSESASQRVPQSWSSGEMAGSERIISVTERTVEPPALTLDASAEPSSATTKTTMPSRGWTARRSTDESVLR